MDTLILSNALKAIQAWRFQQAQLRAHGEAADQAALSAVLGKGRDAGPLLAELRKDGVTAIKNYWTAKQCESARNELNRLMAEVPQCVRHFSNGADKRVFGAEMAGEQISAFHHDPFLRGMGEMDGGFRLYNFATLGARIDAVDGNRGSGEGWHRDAFGYQYKAIIYLSDVTEDNGPFEYYRGSHTLRRVVLDAALGRLPPSPETRIDGFYMDRLIARGAINPQRFIGKAGTVILANTTGIHRGAPLKAGNRYALTNYFYLPYQIGQSQVDKFTPLVPGVEERLAPFLDAERSVANTAKHGTEYAQ